MKNMRKWTHVRFVVGLGVAWATALPAAAQTLAQVEVPTEPLALKAKGSFIVGGESALQTPQQISSFFDRPLATGGHVTVNQMYVQFMVPMKETGAPVVMVHGATLSAKTYETTPDGRMGWDEYFVRRGHATYLADQVGRGRSGFDVAIYNDVRAGARPPSALPHVFRHSNELNWLIFRFGPRLGVPFADAQFPVEAAGQIAAQAVPDLSASVPTPNPTYKAMADLAVQLKGAVLMGHSQSGAFPIHAALIDSSGVRGLVLLEPGGCSGGNRPYSDEQVRVLSRIPILAVFGDHLDQPTGLFDFSWRGAFNDCKAFVERINRAGGRAELFYPPDRGIRGNSHMLMQDKNNLQIADVIIDWMDRTAVQRRGAGGTHER